MSKCTRGHRWTLQNAGAKTWVVCENCTDRFPLGPECNGTLYQGPVPEKFMVKP